MSNNTKTEGVEDRRVETGYAALIDGTEGPQVVHGVALGEGDITHGGSGKKTLWPRETLEEAADGLQGQPLATNYDHDANDPRPQTPSEAIIGSVTWSGYKPGVGVLFEAEVDDPDIARSIENGRLEVSPLVSREVEPLEDHDTADYKATNIHQWRDLATVVNGASPSNEITVGSQPLKAEALHEAVESLQADEEESVEALKEMHGLVFDGTAEGKLDKTEIEENFGDHALYGSGENKEDYSYWLVDADGNLRKGNLNSAWQLGCRGQCPSAEDHDATLMDLAQEFDSVPEWAMEGNESMGSVTDAEAAEALGVTISDDGEKENNSPEHDGGTTSNADAESLTMELNESQEALLEAVDDPEDAIEALEEFDGFEEPKIVEQAEYESLESKVTEVRGVLEESLAEQTSLKEETISSLSFEALASEFEDEDGNMEVEALRQVPETEAPDEETDEFESLAEDADMEKAEALYRDYTTLNLPSKDGLKDDIVEALGVDDFDKAKEVLD